MYPPPPGASEIMGVEVSGIVEEVGKSGTYKLIAH
jgi:threonine dehydrogenase-like Zn-dependent dehydrogenase